MLDTSHSAVCQQLRCELKVGNFGEDLTEEFGLHAAGIWFLRLAVLTVSLKASVMTLDRTNSFSSGLQSAYATISTMFVEIFMFNIAVMKDKILGLFKVGDAHFSDSDVLYQSQVTSSPPGSANLFRTNCFMEPYISSQRTGLKPNSARSTNGHHIGGCYIEEVRSEVVLHGAKEFSSCELVYSSTEGDTQSSPCDLQSTEHMPNDQPSSTPLDAIREWNVRANPTIIGSINPIRRTTESLVVNTGNGKQLISLALGDPAQFGPHMRVPDVVNSALIDVVRDGNYNGYALSSGLLETRRAVADYLSNGLDHRYTPEDVTLTSGCSQAIQHSIDVLRFDGCNILLPRPGFPVYETLCSYFGVECRHYDLLQDRDWEVDLSQVADLANCNTAAIIVCNPGNPCGTVYDYQHLSQIATLAESLKVPIIADEVYSSLVFGQHPFIPMAKFSSRAPVLTVGGVSKNWLVPGWRLGWLAVSDPHSILRQARVDEALTKIAQITLGPSTLMQAALPKLLQSTPANFFDRIRDSLRSGAEVCLRRIEKIDGLECPTRPQGSMFMMVRMDPSAFQGLRTDVEFSVTLLKEESVLVLPGSAFGRPNWIRIVFALSLYQLYEAWDRIERFCRRHSRLS